MSVFADDLFLVCPKKMLVELRKTIDADLKIIWGETLAEGTGWVRYLGKEWRVQHGRYSVRVPPAYWEELLRETGMES
eukprot:8442708-Heterocapsa_arctica.AAC.1